MEQVLRQRCGRRDSRPKAMRHSSHVSLTKTTRPDRLPSCVLHQRQPRPQSALPEAVQSSVPRELKRG